MAGDIENAKKWYIASRKQAAEIGLREGVLEAEVALRRLDRMEKYGPGHTLRESDNSKEGSIE